MLANPGLDARWSPDGRRIAYVSTVFSGYPGKIVVMDRDGSNSRTVTTESQTFPDFTWSPDGQRILFVGGCCDRSDLYSIPVAGGRATNLTNNDANRFVHHPDWYRPR
jgi:TolB protein